MVDGSIQHHGDTRNVTANRELEAVFVEAFEIDATLAKRFEERLLLDSDATAENADHWLRNYTYSRILMRPNTEAGGCACWQ